MNGSGGQISWTFVEGQRLSLLVTDLRTFTVKLRKRATLILAARLFKPVDVVGFPNRQNERACPLEAFRKVPRIASAGHQ